jgi:HK97 family phage major capsid protein
VNAVLDATRTRRDKTQGKLDELLAKPQDEQRELDATEGEEFTKLITKRSKLDEQIRALEAEEARVEKAAAAAVTPEEKKSAPGDFVVRSEPGVYRQDAATRFGEASYLRDLATYMVPGAESLGSREDAQRRLHQNWVEVQRDAQQAAPETRKLAHRIVDEQTRWAAAPDAEARVNPNTTAGTGGEFVPPLWLVSQYVRFERFGRVVANRVQNLPLPPGIDIINLPKITTGALTAVQTANAAPVTSRDIVTSTVSASVRTIAGQEDISLQLLEQSPIAMDNVVFDDLSRDYDLQLDTQLLIGTGASGQHQGVITLTSATSNTDITKANAVTVSSATFADSSTSATQYRSIVNGINQIETLRVASPTAIWVHPRRANSWLYATDSQNRPLFVSRSYGPFNADGVAEASPMTQGVAGELVGLPVVKDGNMPTTMNATATTGGTADAVVVVKEDDLLLWEGTMRMRALPEILSGTLQIRYQVYSYSAFMPNRYPPSISILTSNTGLAAPGF